MIVTHERIETICDRLRAERWVCLESGGSRQTVTIIARRGAVTVSVTAPGREAAWERLAVRIPPNDGRSEQTHGAAHGNLR
jgi:hypothetical protein